MIKLMTGLFLRKLLRDLHRWFSPSRSFYCDREWFGGDGGAAASTAGRPFYFFLVAWPAPFRDRVSPARLSPSPLVTLFSASSACSGTIF